MTGQGFCALFDRKATEKGLKYLSPENGEGLLEK